MDAKKVLVLLVVLLFSASAFAALPTVSVHNDFNNYDPAGSTVAIRWDYADVDNPPDVNMLVYYMWDTNLVRVEITSATGGTLDRNAMRYCDPGFDTNRQCELTWTIPTGLDGNFHFDVNAYDITNSDDLNGFSGSVNIDTNACFVQFKNENDGQLTLTTTCSGRGSTATTYYQRSRNRTCPTGFRTYTDTIDLRGLFGEITFCYFSTDNLGNSSTQVSQIFTLKQGTFNIVVLLEVILAALLISMVLAFGFLRNELSVEILMMMLGIALVLLLSIIIIAELV